MSQRQRIVWVVMHYEVMGLADSPWVDSVQFHVSSSLEKAEAYIRRGRTAPYSWWQVHPHRVDSADVGEGGEVYHYSYRGVRLKSAPAKRAMTAYRKHAARRPELHPSRPSEPRRGADNHRDVA